MLFLKLLPDLSPINGKIHPFIKRVCFYFALRNFALRNSDLFITGDWKE